MAYTSKVEPPTVLAPSVTTISMATTARLCFTFVAMTAMCLAAVAAAENGNRNGNYGYQTRKVTTTETTAKPYYPGDTAAHGSARGWVGGAPDRAEFPKVSLEFMDPVQLPPLQSSPAQQGIPLMSPEMPTLPPAMYAYGGGCGSYWHDDNRASSSYGRRTQHHVPHVTCHISKPR